MKRNFEDFLEMKEISQVIYKLSIKKDGKYSEMPFWLPMLEDIKVLS